jgi:hypothetical protein
VVLKTHCPFFQVEQLLEEFERRAKEGGEDSEAVSTTRACYAQTNAYLFA